ncbi:MAG: hypothetical protein JO071_06750 [Deltaproteobacteria bacterium]|nr:hypothetical protein [Deltaproteobacteria bacterium]
MAEREEATLAAIVELTQARPCACGDLGLAPALPSVSLWSAIDCGAFFDEIVTQLAMSPSGMCEAYWRWINRHTA